MYLYMCMCVCVCYNSDESINIWIHEYLICITNWSCTRIATNTH